MNKPKKKPAPLHFINASLDRALVERVNRWRDEQEFHPTLRAVLEIALREFLADREGKR